MKKSKKILFSSLLFGSLLGMAIAFGLKFIVVSVVLFSAAIAIAYILRAILGDISRN